MQLASTKTQLTMEFVEYSNSRTIQSCTACLVGQFGTVVASFVT